jgi:NAD-dependent dihydropyrimidine dehydrogenase PreA subunit
MSIHAHVIISNGQSNNPVKRQLEETLADCLARVDGVTTLVIPNLYDLTATSNTIQRLKTLPGDLIVLTWLYDRAAHWILDRNGVLGNFGETDLEVEEGLEDEEFDEAESDAGEDETHRVADDRPSIDRNIYCIDLRKNTGAVAFEDEVKRIVALAAESRPQELLDWLQGTGTPEQLERFVGQAEKVDETAGRRWYPVIDFSRCTNCMECIDFCLFGVYGVDGAETILVEQPDNCRKGCPACSRVCPENAIIFPQHKTPAIAGAPAEAGGLKIDLTQLFGGGAGAVDVAANERDEQLMLAGRDAVGLTVGIAKRQQESAAGPSDALDDLVDELDSLDL